MMYVHNMLEFYNFRIQKMDKERLTRDYEIHLQTGTRKGLTVHCIGKT